MSMTVASDPALNEQQAINSHHAVSSVTVVLFDLNYEYTLCAISIIRTISILLLGVRLHTEITVYAGELFVQ